MTEPEVYPLETGFRDAWRILREKTAMLRTPKECTACSMRELCGVCAAVCVAETGRFDGVPKYLCQKTEHQIRLLQSYCGKEEV
jgi:radical SAM protein with 4Fe4S-binding SPASM domain